MASDDVKRTNTEQGCPGLPVDAGALYWKGKFDQQVKYATGQRLWAEKERERADKAEAGVERLREVAHRVNDQYVDLEAQTLAAQEAKDALSDVLDGAT